MNGGKAGDLCFRNDEFLIFRAAEPVGIVFIYEPDYDYSRQESVEGLKREGKNKPSSDEHFLRRTD